MHFPRDDPALCAGTTTEISGESVTTLAQQSVHRRAQLPPSIPNLQKAIELGRAKTLQHAGFAKIVSVDPWKHVPIEIFAYHRKFRTNGVVVYSRSFVSLPWCRHTIWICERSRAFSKLTTKIVSGLSYFIVQVGRAE